MTPSTLPVPGMGDISVEHLEALVSDLRTAKRIAAEYKATADKKEDYLIEIVEKYGHMPPRAERSRRMCLSNFTLTVSRSETVVIDYVRVSWLLDKLRASGCALLFKKLFREETKYSIAAGAREFVAGKLPAKAPRNLKQLFAACISGKTGNPRLSILSLKDDDLKARSEKSQKSGKSKKQKGSAA